MMVVACGAAMVSSSPQVPSPRWPWSLSNQAQQYLAMRGLHMIAAGVGVLWEGGRHGPSLYYSSWRVQSLRRGISGVTITKHWLSDAIEQSAATVWDKKKSTGSQTHLMLQEETWAGSCNSHVELVQNMSVMCMVSVCWVVKNVNHAFLSDM